MLLLASTSITNARSRFNAFSMLQHASAVLGRQPWIRVVKCHGEQGNESLTLYGRYESDSVFERSEQMENMKRSQQPQCG